MPSRFGSVRTLACALLLPLSIGGGVAAAWAVALDGGTHHTLESHGYVRTGAGLSRGKAGQSEFQAPGARAKYRLGNEANTNYEFGFDYRYFPSGVGHGGRYLQGYAMMADFQPYATSSKLRIDKFSQFYLSAAGFVASDVKLWAGRRYYDRKDIHLNDHYWLNVGQGAHGGLGVEGVPLLSGRGKLALFRMRDRNVAGLGGFSGRRGTLRSSLLDVRLAEVATNPGGHLTLWAAGAIRHSNDALGFSRRSGYGLGVWHDQRGGFCQGCSNTVALLYRKGAACTQGDFNPNPVREDQGYDLKRSQSWEINDNFLIERAAFAAQWTVVLRSERFGKSGARGDRLLWYSTGIRPVVYLSDHWNLATELGVDVVDDAVHDRKGSVRKSTVALQLAKGRGYYSRPLLRAFVTHAAWSAALRGLVASGAYGDRGRGWSYGMQVESWW